MRLAFYAPLKAPDHTVPSGDRAMARALIQALSHAGGTVTLASDLRTRDGRGDRAVQRDILAQAEALLPDVIARGRVEGWRAWITYHNYYKAPDLLGPAAARALGIPYLLVEATRARKRLGGPWDAFARRAEAACDAAEVVYYLTAHDHAALKAYAPPGQTLVHLRPFLAREDLPATASGETLLAVGMMRHAAKLASYRLIADALLRVPEVPLLEIVGDGPARDPVEAAFTPLAGRVRFLGALDSAGVAAAYARARALVWPGANEAFGMTYLEAQAYGLPVIAQDRPGVRDVLYPRAYPSPEGGAEALAEFLRTTLAQPPRACDIQAHMKMHHLLPAAAATLAQGLALTGVRP